MSLKLVVRSESFHKKKKKKKHFFLFVVRKSKFDVSFLNTHKDERNMKTERQSNLSCILELVPKIHYVAAIHVKRGKKEVHKFEKLFSLDICNATLLLGLCWLSE